MFYIKNDATANFRKALNLSEIPHIEKNILILCSCLKGHSHGAALGKRNVKKIRLLAPAPGARKRTFGSGGSPSFESPFF